ncbi:MAG: 1,4-alpha-glucan branching protein GlgB, partial [Nannocystaceae bacterium]|nr:1,4-alpha-glucan branching protein GlgB [Nannocystaceae bacterium]
DWSRGNHPLVARGDSGVWEGFVPGVAPGELYKFHVSGPSGWSQDKADPMAQSLESAPKTAAVVTDLRYAWQDEAWMADRGAHQQHDAPISIYEVHLGSWMRVPEERDRFLSYREIAPKLAAHVKRLGFTHVELLPIMAHPFYGSWGYQVTGYLAASARYGTPTDLMALIDYLHAQDIGVILDWVPSHFPEDAHALAFFDGTHLYEHADPRQGFHPDWSSCIFNYGRNEVQSFLVSSALYWLDLFHADGLRVDGVASMLYRDYSRKAGEWIPNKYGGRENLEAIAVLRRLNEAVYRNFPDVQTFAEESTAWPMVSRPTHVGGLGFGFKWDMGWMHDTLRYLARDPIHRRFHQNELAFRMIYAWGESFLLSLSHDEVVHGKGSLLSKMPGDTWQQFANLRLLFACQWTQPGKKLLFMGGEFGQRAEWNHDRSLDWHLLDDPAHAGVMQWVADLNRALTEQPALHQRDHDPEGFLWIDFSDADSSILSFARRGNTGAWIVVVFNFTPMPRYAYRIGTPAGGRWRELLNSDAEIYGGSGVGNGGEVHADAQPLHGQSHSVELTLPPLGALVLCSDAHVEAP